MAIPEHETGTPCPACGGAVDPTGACPRCAAAPGPGDRTHWNCPNCGGTMDADADACPACGAAAGDDARTCPNCQGAVEPGAGVCPTCGGAVTPGPSLRNTAADPVEFDLPAAGAGPDYGVPVKLLACEGCGNRLAVDAAVAEPGRCPLCGSTSLAAGAAEGTGPARAAPFSVPPARATALFHQWLKRQFLRPAPWIALARSRGLRGVYLPLWTVDAVLRSRWSAEVARGPVAVDAGGAPLRRWERVSGERVDRVSRSWPAIPMTAESPALASLHDRGGLVPWAPEYLAGWTAVVPRGGPDEAWRGIREVLYERAREQVAAELPKDGHRALRVETTAEVADVAASLVPVYLAAVPWRGKVYRFVVDGRTGRVDGEAPYSAGKLAALVGAGVLAVAAMGGVLAQEDPPSRSVIVAPAP
jgi:RNA polymerase subunit RPABC4/transcription elongation factor Spt4